MPDQRMVVRRTEIFIRMNVSMCAKEWGKGNSLIKFVRTSGGPTGSIELHVVSKVYSAE